MKFFIRPLVAGLLALVVHAGLRAEPALMGNKQIGSQSLDVETLKAVLLGKKVMIGAVRVVVVIAKGSEAQERFLQQYLGMSTAQFQNHWRRLFMTGGGSAPKIVGTDSEACQLLAETEGAIAITDVRGAQLADRITVLFLTTPNLQ